MKNEYNMTFFEAAEACLNGKGFIRGDGFGDGVYVKSSNEVLVVVCKKPDSISHVILHNLILSKNLLSQKFKLFTVANDIEIGLKK